MNLCVPLLNLLILALVLIAQCHASKIPEGMPLILPKDATPSPLLRDPPTPPLLLPRDATTPPPPPLVFPEDVKNYNIVPNNATILATLTHKDDTNQESAEDNNQESDDLNKTPGSEAPAKESDIATRSTERIQESSSSSPDFGAELVQPIHQDRESNEHEEQFNKHHHHKQHKADYMNHMRVTDTSAIMAGSFAVIAVLGFVGLVMWRQMLERKYGTRERLVTEDTYYTNNDLRHFEL
ncbi:uncharacterized protein LOC113377315 [Ctenocephalides felis]|uniref:uncharacterized protein LOC113377315 n=1 Tax=Ctenocephalides felis TaxID=7515 RepID=UPI000E6E3233|nr:uncharacterized protein LOC113377315 [Ctenocephalides felis]